MSRRWDFIELLVRRLRRLSNVATALVLRISNGASSSLRRSVAA